MAEPRLLTISSVATLIGAAATRSASLPSGVAVVDRSRPEVSDQGEEAAPGDSEDGTVSDWGSQQQSPQRVDNGREGLVLGEPAHPDRHRVRVDKCTTGERQQELEDEGEAIGSRRRFANHAEHHSHPRDREGEQRDDAERREPCNGTRRGPEAYEQCDPDDETDGDYRPKQASENLSGQHRGAGDCHGAESDDDAFGHVHAEVYRSRRASAAHGHEDNRGRDVVDIGAAVQAGTYSTAEHVDEQQQRDDRC